MHSGSADANTFAQVPNSQPTNRNLVNDPSRQTEGAVIRISKIKEIPSFVAGATAPNGDDLVDDYLSCTKK